MSEKQIKTTYLYALDLSLNSTGVCIFSNDGELIEMLTIDTHSEKETKLKLKIIGDALKKLMKRYVPNKVVIEQGFTLFNRSTQAVFKVHGVVSYIFYKYEQIYYPATTVKKQIAGKGNATKIEVQHAILDKHPEMHFSTYDESDAFAVGRTYFMKEVKENATLDLPK